jgi:hypothetical protein
MPGTRCRSGLALVPQGKRGVPVVDDLLRLARDKLAESGFEFAEDTGAGPMGSRRVQFSSDRLTIEFVNDRGELAVAAGPRSAPTFGFRIWAELLGFDVPPEQQVDQQLGFFLDHLHDIDMAVRRDHLILAKLKETNRRYVKEYLGLSPDTPAPGEGHALCGYLQPREI